MRWITNFLSHIFQRDPLIIEEQSWHGTSRSRVFLIRARNKKAACRPLTKADGIPKMYDEWPTQYQHSTGYILCAIEYTHYSTGDNEFRLVVTYRLMDRRNRDAILTETARRRSTKQ